MVWASVVFAALLILALLYPFLKPRLSRGRRARGAHRGGVVHWYPNYDEDLRFEPQDEHDIVTISRHELASFGYRPGDETAPVPRTFRGRVAGDHRLRLWTSAEDLRPIWICCWQSAIDLPGAMPTAQITRPLTREMLTPTRSGPHPRLGDETTRELPDNSSEDPMGTWEKIEETDSPDESSLVLIPETARFACTETTPLSSHSAEMDSSMSESADPPSERVGDPLETVNHMSSTTKKSTKRKRSRRKSRGR